MPCQTVVLSQSLYQCLCGHFFKALPRATQLIYNCRRHVHFEFIKAICLKKNHKNFISCIYRKMFTFRIQRRARLSWYSCAHSLWNHVPDMDLEVSPSSQSSRLDHFRGKSGRARGSQFLPKPFQRSQEKTMVFYDKTESGMGVL